MQTYKCTKSKCLVQRFDDLTQSQLDSLLTFSKMVVYGICMSAISNNAILHYITYLQV